MAELTLPESVLVKLARHWQEVASIWVPDLYYCDVSYEETYHGTDFLEKEWSCFFVSELLRDLFGMPRETRHAKGSIVHVRESQIASILAMPNTGHTFSCQDHLFTIISYLGSDGSQVLYYCDYWMEARETNCFRMEEISLRRAQNLLTAYVTEDLETFARFSSNDTKFVRDYAIDYAKCKRRLDPEMFAACNGLTRQSYAIEEIHWQIASAQLDAWLE